MVSIFSSSRNEDKPGPSPASRMTTPFVSATTAAFPCPMSKIANDGRANALIVIVVFLLLFPTVEIQILMTEGAGIHLRVKTLPLLQERMNLWIHVLEH